MKESDAKVRNGHAADTVGGAEDEMNGDGRGVDHDEETEALESYQRRGSSRANSDDGIEGAGKKNKSVTYQKYGSGAEILDNVKTRSEKFLNSTKTLGQLGFSAASNFAQSAASSRMPILGLMYEPEEAKQFRAEEDAKWDWENRHYDCCTSSKLFHSIAKPGFVLVSVGVVAATGYLTVSSILNQGVLSLYSAKGINGVHGADRSSPERMNNAFEQSSADEQRAFVEASWYSSMFVVGFAFLVFSIIRTSRALPQWVKIVYYCTCIPMVVIAQWISNTCEFFMYMDYSFQGSVSQWTSQVHYASQISTWVAGGLCGVAIFSAAFAQMRAGCC